jgi:tetrahydromethanopterin S-methyltransferase subunit G
MVEINLEDCSLDKLEIKKRICEEKLQEIKEYSIPHRISKKIGYDIYIIAGYLLLVGIIVMIIGFSITFTPMFLNQTSPENPIDMTGMTLIFVGMFTMMPAMTLLGNDRTAPYRRKLKEINRVVRIKQEVEKGNQLEIGNESETLEYKSSFKYDYKTKQSNPLLSKAVVQSILGFLNKDDGTLVIGVSDDKEILGIENDLKLFNNSWDKYQLGIQDAIRDYTDTPLSDFVKVKQVEKDDKILCKIMIKRSPKPVFYTDGNKQDLYIRDGNRTQKLSTKQALEYVNSHWFLE